MDASRLLASTRRALAELLTNDGERDTRRRAGALVAELDRFLVRTLKASPAGVRRRAVRLEAAYRATLSTLRRQARAGAVTQRRPRVLEIYFNGHLARFRRREIGSALNARIIAYLDDLPRSAQTKKHAHTAFRRIAAEAGYHFAPHRFHSTGAPRRMRLLSEEEVARVCKAARSADRPIAKRILLAAATGMRIGEAMAVTSDDLGPRGVAITKTRCHLTGAITRAKTPSSVRVLPLAPSLAAEIRPYLDAPCPADWMPTWHAICKRVGLPRIGIHALRHAWAARALQRLPIEAVSRALGHADPAYTDQMYARTLDVGAFRAAIARVNR